MILVEKMLFLRHVPLFSKMAPSQLGRIANITQETVFPAGTEIFQQGSPANHLFLIVEGEVLIHQGESPLRTLQVKDSFGEMSIIEGEPRSASAKALNDCLMLCIGRQDFNELLFTHGEIAMALILTLTRWLR